MRLPCLEDTLRLERRQSSIMQRVTSTKILTPTSWLARIALCGSSCRDQEGCVSNKLDFETSNYWLRHASQQERLHDHYCHISHSFLRFTFCFQIWWAIIISIVSGIVANPTAIDISLARPLRNPTISTLAISRFNNILLLWPYKPVSRCDAISATTSMSRPQDSWETFDVMFRPNPPNSSGSRQTSG